MLDHRRRHHDLDGQFGSCIAFVANVVVALSAAFELIVHILKLVLQLIHDHEVHHFDVPLVLPLLQSLAVIEAQMMWHLPPVLQQIRRPSAAFYLQARNTHAGRHQLRLVLGHQSLVQLIRKELERKHLWHALEVEELCRGLHRHGYRS